MEFRSKTHVLLCLLLLLSSHIFLSSGSDLVTKAIPPLPSEHHPNGGAATAPAPSPLHHHNHHHHPHHHPPASSPLHAPSPAPTGHHPHHHPHPHHHSMPPAHAPRISPSHAPSHSPVVPQPPKGGGSAMKRTFVGVQGVVYCKSCKYAGVDTLLGATPISGAVVVQVRCNNSRFPLALNTTKGTDKNGFFYMLMGPNTKKIITNYGAHKCKAYLMSSPQANCSKPADFNGGISGAPLRHGRYYIIDKLLYTIFSVGPFAFEPACPH